jgi:hypothetical protein
MKNLFRRSKLVFLIAALSIAGLAATAIPAAHAYSQAGILASEQGVRVWVTGSNFVPYATVRVEVMDSSADRVLGTQYTEANFQGQNSVFVSSSLFCIQSYLGHGYAVADEMNTGRGVAGEAWASTLVDYPATCHPIVNSVR